ncbi:hypothetical protein D9757_006368 [Collybiopsis confluens]|uniref:protein-tyrosine-phosphatase n=1 Tax=Collybiopsis confluens TaxID=2823264 RepID=A0A8H5M6T1_9AGAR|nr:hypothetical protein D9757_006368 [Collybiopsis confluens]
MQRKKGPPSMIKTEFPRASPVSLALGPASADSEHASSPRPRSLRNLKKLSLTLPSAQSSSLSLSSIHSEPKSADPVAQPTDLLGSRPRRPSVVSLPPTSSNPTVVSFLQHNKEQEGDSSVPYADGPIQIIPGIWLGSEENARDWNSLIERGIKSILNVAKEVASPFEPANTSQVLRSVVSTPNLNKSRESKPTYHPPHPAIGRPGLHYLKLDWSHGQRDLVADGFPSAMTFTDEALARGDGVLIHCQCGISRSATLTIAIVMRAAAERSPAVPSEIWALKGMQPAYDYVKEKSQWIGPNMSLIYQLLDYERKLKGSDPSSPSSDRSSLIAEEEAEWSRRRQMMTDEESEEEHDNKFVMQEALMMDRAMEERIVARKSSVSSVSSSNGVGMGTAWRSRYSRKRAGSVASSTTNGSLISEDLVEEEEEQELLGVGGGFESDGHDPGRRPLADDEREHIPESSASSPSSDNSPDNSRGTIVLPPGATLGANSSPFTPRTARPRPPPISNRSSLYIQPPPSAPVWKTSFGSNGSLPPPPPTAFRSQFDLSTPKPNKRRPTPLGSFTAIPPSPIAIIAEGDSSSDASETESIHEATVLSKFTSGRVHHPSLPSSVSSISSAANSSRRPSASATSLQSPSAGIPKRLRTESRRPAPPPLHLRPSVVQRAKEQNLFTLDGNAPPLKAGTRTVPVSTPSQTLFVFPPSPTLTTRTPSTMTLTSAVTPREPNIPFPAFSSTPRVATFRNAQGKRRSFIGLGAPPTPTTGFSRVDARGYVGFE